MIASTHGDLRSVVNNPELQALIGGTQKVILSDDTLSRMGDQTHRKSRVDRASDPVFDVIVELRKGFQNDCWIIRDSALAVDLILQGVEYVPHRRSQDPSTGMVFHEMLRGRQQAESIPFASYNHGEKAES